MGNALPARVRQEWDGEAWAIAQVAAAPVPALVARNTGEILGVNEHANVLLERGTLAPALRALVSDTCVVDRPQVARFSREGFDGDPVPRTFDLTLVPVPFAAVLVIAREVSLEANLIQALTSSRELFRDLALCSTDFAFETDVSGVFVWVSPGGALGYSAVELNGARPRDVFGDVDGIEIFATRTPVKDDEIHCSGKGHRDAHVALTIVPVIDARGTWCGTRGVARDVTALRTHERAAAHIKRREELIGATVGAMRGQIEPRRMMMAAADALLNATESLCVTIRPKNLDLFARVGDASLSGAVELTAMTSYQGAINGSLCLARPAGSKAYGAEEKALLDAVVPHLGIAIALAESLSAIASQALTDPLTGLLNRRAFFAEGARRLGAQARAGRASAILIVDCDDFSVLNETSGEQAGDALLCAVGGVLTAECRDRGCVARLDGDAFGLLLDTCSLDEALASADRIGAAVARLSAAQHLRDGITASVGVAYVEAEAGEGFEDLLARARGALAAAKHEGRDQVAVATSNEVVSC